MDPIVNGSITGLTVRAAAKSWYFIQPSYVTTVFDASAATKTSIRFSAVRYPLTRERATGLVPSAFCISIGTMSDYLLAIGLVEGYNPDMLFSFKIGARNLHKLISLTTCTSNAELKWINQDPARNGDSSHHKSSQNPTQLTTCSQ